MELYPLISTQASFVDMSVEYQLDEFVWKL